MLLITLSFVSCKKSSEEVYVQSAKDAALAEVITFDVLREVQRICPEFIVNQSYNKNGITVTAVPEITNNIYPKTLTVAYGTNNEGVFGKKRSGNITVVVNSGNILSDSLVVNFDNYSVSGTQILGAIHYNFTNGAYYINFGSSDMSLINGNGTMKFQGNLTASITSDNGTVTILDDEYAVAITAASGIDFSQRSFTVTGNSHLIDFDCNNILTSGESKLTPNQEKQQTVNFGAGNCDNIGTLKSSSGDQTNFNF